MIVKSVKLMIASIGLCLGSAAMSEDLVYYTFTDSGSVYYYDSETVRRSGDIVTVWIKIDAAKDRSVSYRTVRMKFNIDCSDETIGVLSYNEYRPNGSVMASESTNYPNMEPVIPGSVGNSLFEAVCAN